MAKRFITTEIFADPWFMDLPSKYKLFWIFLIASCNHAGIWMVNYKLAAYYCGDHLEPSECERIMRERIIKIDDGKYWFIPKFIEFQYGTELKENNPATKSVIKLLQKYELFSFLPKIKIIQGATKELQRSYLAPKDKDKDKDKDNVKDKDASMFEELPLDEKLKREFIRGFKRNPGDVEIDDLRAYVQKYGLEQLTKAMRDVARRNIKSLQYFLDNLDTVGNLKPYPKQVVKQNTSDYDDEKFQKPLHER